MRRTSLAALLAAPLLLVFPASVTANHHVPCFAPFGGGGVCMSWFNKLHQHGPLYNYGPYYGYPPFEPYGPWNAYLHYNPWYYSGGSGNGGHGGHGHNLFGGRHGGNGCGGHCFHANWLQGGWFRGHDCVSCGGRDRLLSGHGCRTCGKGVHRGSSCSGCTAHAGDESAARFAGAGSPEDAASFYIGLPSITATAASNSR